MAGRNPQSPSSTPSKDRSPSLEEFEPASPLLPTAIGARSDEGQRSWGNNAAEHAAGAEPRVADLQERMAIPVLLAAVASVPAVFLTLLDEPARTAGVFINALSGAVILAEVVVLFAVSENKLRWLKKNPGRVALGFVVLLAVVLSIGPLQLLRLVKMVGALRIMRVGKLVRAGRILRERAGLNRTWQRASTFVVSLLAALFVAAVLSDPTSHSRRVLDGALHWLGITGVFLAGAILAIATYVLRTNRRRRGDSTSASAADSPDGGRTYQPPP